MSSTPRLILLFSGKRKTGKDYVTDQLHENLFPNSSCLVRLSGPLKKCYAENHGLDLEKLLGSSDYKEKYRLDMIRWSEEIRNRDTGYFCRAALRETPESQTRGLWIVPDCRRITDFEYFETTYPGGICRRIRLVSSEATRAARGYVFKQGVDDAESECGLDGVDVKTFAHILENEGAQPLEQLLSPLLKKEGAEFRSYLEQEGLEP